MTAAQKTAKANFKKAIEYRKKTGVSLKEAFAHVYGKKVGAAPKKKAAKKAAKKVVKKAAPKKAAKKVVKKQSTLLDFRINKKTNTKKGKVKAHTRRVSGVKKKVSEQSVLNKIHKVKDQVSQLDELQHKHMIGSIDKYKDSLRFIKIYEGTVKNLKNKYKNLSATDKIKAKKAIKNLVSIINETKTHARELKKLF